MDLVENESALSDSLLRQLIAVGQADILVGLPTLNNAATVVSVVRAVHACFARDFARLRTVLFNSDGGSTDGTPDLIRNASFTEADMVQTSHSLRTLHRVVAPYHGLPGKHTALRTVFAVADLIQAKVVVVIDPGGPATTVERVTELIHPIARADAEFLTPRYRRHPRDGVLITQLVRPLVRALYGVALDEPLGAEFACSGRFASHCLGRDIWSHEAARFAIDLWLRTEALANGYSIGQIWRPAVTAAGARTTLREAVRQVVLSLVECLRAHEPHWLRAEGVAELGTWGNEPAMLPEFTGWDYQTLGEQARHDILAIEPLLAEVLEPDLLAQLLDHRTDARARIDDELWVRSVYAFAAATRLGRTSTEHLADMFAPVYMRRASSFMSHTAAESPAIVQARLDGLCETFLRLKPALVARWSAEV
jgi:hypothetical protein